ncbi:MAG TPA: glycosyltransferase 87 family protein [Candidatus Baltobacterales bacterium]|nr:glycosyltransferase 87 family protein [Candidatus Baltobacterales bacterium]
MSRWRWRGSVAMLAICVGFVIYPLIETSGDVINSDWPVFATGARIITSSPGHLYDLDLQRRVETEVTGGRVLVSLGVKGVLPFLAPAWAALVAAPFELLGTDLGGRLWILFGLVCLAAGLLLAVRPRPPSAILPAFASVPTALLLVNAQLHGLVALGVGAAIALWSRPYLAGLALGLTLMKPNLVVTLGVALVLARRWKVLAGWAAAGAILWTSTAVLNPRWALEWFSAAGSAVQRGEHEIDLAHLGVFLPTALRTPVEILLSLATTVAILLLARRRRDDFQAAAAILVAGSVVAALHALPTDLVMVAVAMAIWGRAQWYDWLLLSIGAAACALSPDPAPVIAGLLVVGWVCLRAAGVVSWWRPGPEAWSAR